MDDEPAVYHWGDSDFSYESQSHVDFLQMTMRSYPAGMVLPLEEGETFDFSDLSSQSMLHLRLRLHSGAGEGWMLGLEDEHGFRVMLLAAAYMQMQSTYTWQDLLIPLRDLSVEGVKDGDGGSVLRQHFDWGHVKQFLIRGARESITLDMMDIRLLR